MRGRHVGNVVDSASGEAVAVDRGSDGAGHVDEADAVEAIGAPSVDVAVDQKADEIGAGGWIEGGPVGEVGLPRLEARCSDRSKRLAVEDGVCVGEGIRGWLGHPHAVGVGLLETVERRGEQGSEDHGVAGRNKSHRARLQHCREFVERERGLEGAGVGKVGGNEGLAAEDRVNRI